MKLSRVIFAATMLAVAACNKKTTSSEVSPEPEQGRETAEASAKQEPDTSTPGESSTAKPPMAEAAKPVADPLAGILSPEEIARFEAWFKKYNLSFDAAVLDQDTDGDGYTNRQEFDAGTNPRDPNSLPGVMEGVVVKAVNEVQVPLILLDVTGQKARVMHTGDGSLEVIGQGSQPKGTKYKVASLRHEVKADKHSVLTDVSNVVLEDPASKETVTLVRDLPARSSETHAVLAGPDGTELKVKVGDVVSLPGQGAKQFKVLDLRPDQVLVEDVESKKTLSIAKR